MDFKIILLSTILIKAPTHYCCYLYWYLNSNQLCFHSIYFVIIAKITIIISLKFTNSFEVVINSIKYNYQVANYYFIIKYLYQNFNFTSKIHFIIDYTTINFNYFTKTLINGPFYLNFNFIYPHAHLIYAYKIYKYYIFL